MPRGFEGASRLILAAVVALYLSDAIDSVRICSLSGTRVCSRTSSRSRTRACKPTNLHTDTHTHAYSFSKAKSFCSRIGREGGREGWMGEEDMKARWWWG